MLTPDRQADEFRWRDVPETHRDWLRRQTEDVENFAYRTACDLIRMGGILAEVRSRIKGRFEPWVLAQTPFGRSSAYRLISISKAFSGYVSQIGTIEPSALYILAREKTPKAARSHAVLLADQGQRVTRAVALEILEAHQPVSVNKGDMERVDVARRKVFKEESLQDRRTAKVEEQDARRIAKLGAAVATVLARATTISITAVAEADDPDSVTYSVTTVGGDGKSRFVSGSDLALTILAAAGITEMRFCPACCAKGCGVPARLFGRDKNSTDGIMVRCGPCERGRKKAVRVTDAATEPATQAGRP